MDMEHIKSKWFLFHHYITVNKKPQKHILLFTAHPLSLLFSHVSVPPYHHYGTLPEIPVTSV
jgi:hypothetical protein